MAVPGQLGAPRLSTTPWRPLPCATAGSRSGCHCRRRPLLLRCCASEAPSRRQVSAGVLAACAAALCTSRHAVAAESNRVGRIHHSDSEWRRLLNKEQYRVLRQAATEKAGSSALDKVKEEGVFRCAGCGSPVFQTSAKFNSGTGWPSFYQPIDGAILEVPDNSIFFLPRTEVRCASCESHLGHVFDDGPPPTGLRYCMNGVAMTFSPQQFQT